MAPDKKGAVEAGRAVVFFDESGISLTPNLPRTWAPVGQTPIVRHVLGGKRLHLLGALVWYPDTNQFGLYVQAQERASNSDTIGVFLDGLRQEVSRDALMIWDNLSAHKSEQTTQHLLDHNDWLSVRFLPPYAPELNPVEGLWSNLKASRLAGVCPNNLSELEAAAEQAIDQIDNEQCLLRGFFLGTPLFKLDEFVNELESHAPQ